MIIVMNYACRFAAPVGRAAFAEHDEKQYHQERCGEAQHQE